MDEGFHVVAVPYPGRGHVNPMMNLCELLASRWGILVTFVVTEEWLGFIDSSPRAPNIRLRSIPNVIPSELNRGADFIGFLEAVYTKMEPPFEEFLDRLEEEQQPPVAGILADTYLPWAVAVGNRRNIPVYSLYTMSASFFSVLYHFDLVASHGHLPVNLPEKRDESLDFIPGITSLRLTDIYSISTALNAKSLKLALEALFWVRKAQCLLFTSFYELESHVIDTLRTELPFPVYPIGPSIPYMGLQEKKPTTSLDDYRTWLDSQPRNSVLYVSLGSFLSVSGEQMDEIAMGLRASGVRFLWVARRDPSRMQEMSGDAGLVVPWCDQLRVLCHPSVGGFLTHCGWNSTLEAVFSGVPMLTFPIFWDQPPDSRLIVDEWKVGLRLKGEPAVKELGDGVVGREEIAEIVKRLMDLEGDESKELRRRAGELREACRRAIDDGGPSLLNLNAFVRDVVKVRGGD